MRRILLAFVLLYSTLPANSQGFITEFRKSDDRLHLVWYDRCGNKSVVAEFGDFLAVIEFPQQDSLTNELITRLGSEFPRKPIRYVLHSHHHSHSISSFDPFLQRTKARLVTTRYNLGHIKDLTRDTSRLLNETIVYEGSYTIKDRTNELTVMEIRQSEYRVPALEYNVLYFPRQSAMVTGCLFNKPEQYYEVVNDRKTALKRFLIDKGFQPGRLVPTNTTRANGFLDICTGQMLDSTLLHGIDPYKFTERFQSRDVQYLLASKDSLKKEFSRIPRSYDHIVCANYLIAQGEHMRAVAVLRPLAELYPKEAVIPFFIGQCYESMDMRAEAAAHYRRQVGLLTDESEKDEARKRIEAMERQ